MFSTVKKADYIFEGLSICSSSAYDNRKQNQAEEILIWTTDWGSQQHHKYIDCTWFFTSNSINVRVFLEVKITSTLFLIAASHWAKNSKKLSTRENIFHDPANALCSSGESQIMHLFLSSPLVYVPLFTCFNLPLLNFCLENTDLFFADQANGVLS